MASTEPPRPRTIDGRPHQCLVVTGVAFSVAIPTLFQWGMREFGRV